MTVTIYHNPACGTSRNALAIIRAASETPHIVEYLTDPPGRERLAALIAAAGLAPGEAMRVSGNEALIARLGLEGAEGDAVLGAMMDHPILINRPLVETPLGTVLARPSEKVAEVLAAPPASYIKEDGEEVRLR